MAKKDAQYASRPGTGVSVTVDTILAPANSRGRVFAVSSYATTGALTAVTIRNGTTAGGVALFSLNTIASIGVGDSVSFPQGLYFNNGLFVDVTAGVPQVSVCFTLDGRSDS
jgi:hypothetical protein